MHYTMTLNPAIDCVVALGSELRPGQINRCVQEDYQFGGKGINVSNVLKALGQDTTALGVVAGFTGEALERGLQAMGLRTDFVHAAHGVTRVNLKIMGDEETEINGVGPAIRAQELEMLMEKLDGLTAGDSLVLSGSMPASLDADTYARMLRRVQGRGVLTVVDAAGEPLLRAIREAPFLIKPNTRELAGVFGEEPHEDAQIADCAKRLQAMGARNVLVSMGGGGALLAEESGALHRLACPQGRVMHSVGAGDSMVAGFLAGYVRTGDLAYALRLGMAAGSATAFSLRLCTREQVDALMAGMD